MDGFLHALSAVSVLLMLMSVGYFMGVKGWMTTREKRFVSRYIVNIAVPCNCVVGLLDNLSHNDLAQAGLLVASGVLGVGVTLLISTAAAALLHLPRKRWGVFVAMAGLSNTLFIGIPVCTQLFGQVCMPYVMLYYLANTIFVQSVGILLIERSGDRPASRGGVTGFFWDLVTKPPILALLLSLLLLVADLKLPEPVMRFAEYIGDSVSPLALIYCGFILYELGLKNLRLMPGLPVMLVIRLGLSPVLCWLFCMLFGVSGLARDVFVVESALPVVSQVPVLAGAYGADEEYAAAGACLSVLVCLVTIPFLMLGLG